MALPFGGHTVLGAGCTEDLFGGCCLSPRSRRALFPSLHPVTFGKSPTLQMGWFATFLDTEGVAEQGIFECSEFICLFWGEVDNRTPDEARQFVPPILLPARNRCLHPTSAGLVGTVCRH